MRLPAPQDRKAIEDWIKGQADLGQAAEVLGSLSRLDRGEGWVWAPDKGVLKRTTFPAIRTFDSMRTPEHGEAVGDPTSLASVELGDLRALIEPESDDGDAPARPSSEEIAAAERRGLEQGVAEGRRLQQAEDAETIRQMRAAIQAAGGFLAPYFDEVLSVREPPAPPTIEHQAPRQRLAEKPAKSRQTPGTPGISGPQQRILDALAWLLAAGIEPANRVQIALLSGYSPTSSTFSNYLSALRTAALIDYAGGGVKLTLEGERAADAPAHRLTAADLHAGLANKLGPARWSILNRIITAYPAAISREDVARDTRYSPTSSTFANYISALRSLGFIDYPDRGKVKAEPALFIDKRPRAVGREGSA
jgi:hypothetical protein